MRVTFVYLFVCFFTSKGRAENKKHSQTWAEKYQLGWQQLTNEAQHNQSLNELLNQHFKTFNQPSLDESSKMASFKCDLPASNENPDNAHRVRPGDIKVVGSIGDSITAGYGITANWIWQVLRNDRQESWSSGGIGSLAENVITTPNILRELSSDLKGYSTAESNAGDPGAGFNVAVGGAVAKEMYDQAVNLRDLMFEAHQRNEIDYYNDWKLVNFLIGGNDLCSYCEDTDLYGPEQFAQNVKIALDFLYNDGPPKMIVTLNTIFDITALPAFSEGIVCDVVQWFVCGCATDSSKHEMLHDAQRQYHQILEELVASGRWDLPGRPDFTVVFLPHFQNAEPPKTSTGEVDTSYWAVDCFHPGRQAHQKMALSLWNQMFIEEAKRDRVIDWKTTDNPFCPTEDDPFIKTRLNSGPNADNRGLSGSGTHETEKSWKWPLDRDRFPVGWHKIEAILRHFNMLNLDTTGNKRKIPNFGYHQRIVPMGKLGMHNVEPVIHGARDEEGASYTAATVGGVVGGIAALAAIVAGIIIHQMRKQRREDEQVLVSDKSNTQTTV